MTSVFDQQPSNTASCLSFCVRPSEDSSEYGFLNKHQQNTHEGLTEELQRKTKEFEVRLSEAFNELTFEERQRQQEILHGVDDQVSEEATFIESSLRELDAHLTRTKRGSAYETAEQLGPAYVQAKALRVMFLRSNEYDARAAADQMLLFFKVKQKLFGSEKMVQEITLEDLDEDDRASLNTGWLQLNGKDSSGRVVFVLLSALRAFKELKNELRGKFYFMMQMLKEEENQLKGIVHLLYTVEEFKDRLNGLGFIENAQLSLAIPIKTAAIHFCCSDPRDYALSSITVKIMPAKIVARLRIHLGSHLECQYRIWSFGIPRLNLISNGLNHVPTLAQGDVTLRSVNIQPNASDVLSAGTKTINNPGNQFLRNLVLERWQMYDAGSPETKRAIVDGVIEEIKNSGGRFLKQRTAGRPNVPEPKASIETGLEPTEGTIDGDPITGDPLKYDVVFGKFQNTGKEFLQHLIRERSEEYDALDRGVKGNVVNAVIETIKGKGGRFLVPAQDDGVFLEILDDKAREKISKSFRNYRRTKKY